MSSRSPVCGTLYTPLAGTSKQASTDKFSNCTRCLPLHQCRSQLIGRRTLPRITNGGGLSERAAGDR